MTIIKGRQVMDAILIDRSNALKTEVEELWYSLRAR